MAFMLKIQWNIKPGREDDFRKNQEALCKVMRAHPGVICYHVDYPSKRVSQWTEIYASDASFVAHLSNEKGKAPLGAVIAACKKITCQCWGKPNAKSKIMLAGFETTYHETAKNAFVLNPKADKDSQI